MHTAMRDMVMHMRMMHARAATTPATRTAMRMGRSMRMPAVSGRRRQQRPDSASALSSTLGGCHSTPRGASEPLHSTRLPNSVLTVSTHAEVPSTDLWAQGPRAPRIRLKTLVLRWLPVATNKAIGDMEQGEGTSPIKAVLRSKVRICKWRHGCRWHNQSPAI